MQTTTRPAFNRPTNLPAPIVDRMEHSASRQWMVVFPDGRDAYFMDKARAELALQKYGGNIYAPAA